MASLFVEMPTFPRIVFTCLKIVDWQDSKGDEMMMIISEYVLLVEFKLQLQSFWIQAKTGVIFKRIKNILSIFFCIQEHYFQHIPRRGRMRFESIDKLLQENISARAKREIIVIKLYVPSNEGAQLVIIQLSCCLFR